MNVLVPATFGAMGAALITAIASTVALVYKHRSTRLDEHNRRAFERHLPQYERIFITARSTLDAIRDYSTITRRAVDGSDPFLSQLLSIVSDSAGQFCVAVDWKHNPGMAYLDIELDEKCLHARDLLITWLSRPRTGYGDIAWIRKEGVVRPVSRDEVRDWHSGGYQELIIERRRTVTPAPGDERLLHEINRALTGIVRDLKKVMAH